VKSVNALPDVNNSTMDFVNAFKLRQLSPNQLKEYVLATLSNYKEQFEHEQHILQHLPAGLTQIQSVTNIQEYIALHRKDETPADEFIIKTLSRTFKLNFMIITANGHNLYDTLICEHRHEIHLDNTSIIIQRNNQFYPTKRVISHHHKTAVTNNITDHMETTSSGGAERTVSTTEAVVKIEDNNEPANPWPCDQPHSLSRSMSKITDFATYRHPEPTAQPPPQQPLQGIEENDRQFIR
jgi:hypothetical protein